MRDWGWCPGWHAPRLALSMLQLLLLQHMLCRSFPRAGVTRALAVFIMHCWRHHPPCRAEAEAAEAARAAAEAALRRRQSEKAMALPEEPPAGGLKLVVRGAVPFHAVVCDEEAAAQLVAGTSIACCHRTEGAARHGQAALALASAASGGAALSAGAHAWQPRMDAVGN